VEAGWLSASSAGLGGWATNAHTVSEILDSPGPDEQHATAEPVALEREERRRAREARRTAPRARPHRGDSPGGHATSRLLTTTWGRVLMGAVAALLVATLVGVVALWPSVRHHGPSQAFGGKTYAATVTAVRDVRCPGPTAQRCTALTAELTDGPAKGTTTNLDLGPSNLVSHYSVDDRVRVQAIPAPNGASNAPSFELAGLDRRGTLRWLVIMFAALVLVLARWRGALALVGFALGLLVVVKFIVPAISAGSPPMLVAVVGSLAVMFITVGLTYGISPQSAAAVLGISGSLLFAAVAGTIAVHAAQLDGRSSDLSIYLQQVNSRLSLQGVVLAGLVLGALGVLADMAVTQASAVMALRAANPGLRARALLSGAFGVGRDHLIATTHTLVLVYAGATLPLLLVLQSAGTSATDALNAQDLAEPIVATLIGAMALLISVPLTTALAAALVSHVPPDALPDAHAGHHH
jgi:uncharacterized membrane protein